MIVFVLLLIKIIATLFLYLDDMLVSFFAPSVLMFFTWAKDTFSVTFFAFKSDFLFALFGLYLLMWLITPWLTISNRSAVKIVGLSFVIGSNLFDIICCTLTAFSVVNKIYNLLFSVLIICLSIWTIWKTKGDKGTVLLSPR